MVLVVMRNVVLVETLLSLYLYPHYSASSLSQ